MQAKWIFLDDAIDTLIARSPKRPASILATSSVSHSHHKIHYDTLKETLDILQIH